MKKFMLLLLVFVGYCTSFARISRRKKVEPKQAEEQGDEFSQYPPEVREIMKRPEMKGMKVISVQEEEKKQPIRFTSDKK